MKASSSERGKTERDGFIFLFCRAFFALDSCLDKRMGFLTKNCGEKTADLSGRPGGGTCATARL